MILFIEGSRAVGKTYLINKFFEQVKLTNIEYYKFYFANHIKLLNLQNLDNSSALHYFSLGNIMTILEMNLRKEYKDKIWIFDRAIISAYAWAILRNRLSFETAKSEYLKLLSSNLYSNCKTLVIKTKIDRSTIESTRNKDVFDGLHTTLNEYTKLSEFVEIGFQFLNDKNKNNKIVSITNNFDEESTIKFIEAGTHLLSLPTNK